MIFEVLAKTFKHSFSLAKWVSFRHSFSIRMKPSNDRPIANQNYMVEVWFIGKERKLRIHKRRQRFHISRRSIKLGSRTRNGRSRSNPHSTNVQCCACWTTNYFDVTLLLIVFIFYSHAIHFRHIYIDKTNETIKYTHIYWFYL